MLSKESTFFSLNVTIYQHMYLQQYNKHLEVDLIGSKATNRKQEKIFFYFLPWPGLNPGPSALASEPSHLYSRHRIYCFFQTHFRKFCLVSVYCYSTCTIHDKMINDVVGRGKRTCFNDMKKLQWHEKLQCQGYRTYQVLLV